MLVTHSCARTYCNVQNGWRWIRTTEAICSRFTVCPLWPLGNPSMQELRPDNVKLYHMFIQNAILYYAFFLNFNIIAEVFGNVTLILPATISYFLGSKEYPPSCVIKSCTILPSFGIPASHTVTVFVIS